jgi:hypothetical protein
MSTPAHTLKVGNLTPVELKDSELVTLHKTIFLKFIKAKVTNLTIRRAIVTGRLQSIIKHKTH